MSTPVGALAFVESPELASRDSLTGFKHGAKQYRPIKPGSALASMLPAGHPAKKALSKPPSEASNPTDLKDESRRREALLLIEEAGG